MVFPRALLLVLTICAPLLSGCERAERTGERASPLGGAVQASPRSRGSGVETPGEPGEPQPLVVIAVRAGLDPGDIFLTYLEPEVDAPVVARRDGIVRAVLVEDGQRVRTGQPLARLDDQDARLELERARALSARAAADFERAEKGAAGALVSTQALDAARAQARAARAEEGLARLALDRCWLRSPVGGVVWQIRARPHTPVRESDVLFRVSEPSRVRAQLFLPASLRGTIVAGDPVSLIPVDAPDPRPIAGRVRGANPIVDPATGRFRVEIAADGRDRALAGLTVRASLPRRSPPSSGSARSASGAPAAGSGLGAVLPRGAHIERTGEDLWVWVVRDGRVWRTRVELGAARADGYEVLSGVAPGELVASSGQTLPADGSEVAPRLQGSQGASRAPAEGNLGAR